MYGLIRYIMAGLVLMIIFVLAGMSHGARNRRSNENFIRPGEGAGAVNLNEGSEKIKARFDKTMRIESRFPSQRELFRDVIKIKTGYTIPFDMILYYRGLNLVFFFLDLKVTAIAGFEMGITSENIDLRMGVDRVLFEYGNESLVIHRDGSHILYHYPDRGIILVDDNDDDSIDMYLVHRVLK